VLVQLIQLRRIVDPSASLLSQATANVSIANLLEEFGTGSDPSSTAAPVQTR